jgi:hypothetical protein
LYQRIVISEAVVDFYHFILFLHVFTLLVAAGATSVTKLAITRRDRARTVREVLDWHEVAMSAGKVFPLCLLGFVATGGYMISAAHISWKTGFIVAGLAGVLMLLVSGVFLATRGKAVARFLEGLAARGSEQPAPRLAMPPLVVALPFINTGVALSVAFDMVTKPASIPIALSVLAIGVALGATIGLRRPAAAVEMSRTA